MSKLHIRLLLLACLACAPLCAAQESTGGDTARPRPAIERGVVTGEWSAEFRPDTGAAHLMIHRRVGAEGSDKRYFQLSLYRLEGLSQVLPIQNGSKLKFQLTRDAGTFLFQGVFQRGTGSGDYQFTYSPDFVARMRELGYGDISPEDQFLMAVHDIGVSLARDLGKLKGRSVPLEELIRIGRDGVNSDYLRGLRNSGVEPESERQLAEMRRHGVSESFIRELQVLGYERPSADELINVRRMGVTIAFIKELEAMGYKHPPLGKLADMRMQGITLDSIRELEAMGYGRPTIDQLLGMKLFGVTPGFIRAVESIGYRGLSIDLLGCLRIQGITVDYLKQATDGGRKRVSLRELVRLKNPNGQSKGSCELHVFPDRIPD
jgi:hypothetical protein